MIISHKLKLKFHLLVLLWDCSNITCCRIFFMWTCSGWCGGCLAVGIYTCFHVRCLCTDATSLHWWLPFGCRHLYTTCWRWVAVAYSIPNNYLFTLRQTAWQTVHSRRALASFVCISVTVFPTAIQSTLWWHKSNYYSVVTSLLSQQCNTVSFWDWQWNFSKPCEGFSCNLVHKAIDYILIKLGILCPNLSVFCSHE